MTEPPYGVIWNGLKGAKVFAFLGAGASFVDRPAQSHLSHEHPAVLPSGAEDFKDLERLESAGEPPISCKSR